MDGGYMQPKLAFVALVSLLLAFSPPLAAQEQHGAIQGVVRDASGGVMPGVPIEARSPSVVGVTTAVTDAKGEYRFPALPPGAYEITASLTGFAPEKISDTRLQLGQFLKIDFTLKIASVSTDVIVTGESPIIDVK